MTKQIITLSDNAAQRIKEIMLKAESNAAGVRVGVKSGGCAGMSYIMEYTKEIMSKAESNSVGVRVGVKSGGCAGMSYIMEYTKEINPNDEIIEEKGVKLFVDPGAIMYLLGTEMDYKKEEFSSSFVFKNPNETERCGCGESFKI